MNEKKEISEYQKMRDMFAMYEKILHPDFFFPIVKQMAKVYEEAEEKAMEAAEISKDARWLESEVKSILSGDKAMKSVRLKHLWKECEIKYSPKKPVNHAR